MHRIPHQLSEFDNLDHARSATNPKRRGEPCLRFVLGLDDSLASMHTAYAGPVKKD